MFLFCTPYAFAFGVGELRATEKVADGLAATSIKRSESLQSKEEITLQACVGWVDRSGTATRCCTLFWGGSGPFLLKTSSEHPRRRTDAPPQWKPR